MQGKELGELAVFLSVARHLSFKDAAIERSVAPSVITLSIQNLENRLGTKLFNRTTRRVSLTDAGRRLSADVQPAFSQIRKAVGSLDLRAGVPCGTLRLNVPTAIGPFIFKVVTGALVKRYPAVALELSHAEKSGGLRDSTFDAAIRQGLRASANMTAVRIKPSLRAVVVGSPEYFATRKMPRTPLELMEHSCIGHRSAVEAPWKFGRQNKTMKVEVKGRVILDDQALMVEAAIQGLGLAYVWEDWASRYLKEGLLVRCLSDWCAPVDNLYIHYPSGEAVSAALRAVIDALRTPARRVSEAWNDTNAVA